jgi:predicted 3-demethylubiquinone-9 3-methyltransferase (glyoxalase superfamily)
MIIKYVEAGKDSKVASVTYYAREGANDKDGPVQPVQ